jgi:spore germination protein KA
MKGLFTFIYKLFKTGRPSNRNGVHEFGFRQDGMPIGERLNAVLMKIRQELGESPDLITRKFDMPNVPHIPIAAVYMEGLTNKDKINDFAERLLFYEPDNVENANKAKPRDIYDAVLIRAKTVGEVKVQHQWSDMMNALLSGDIVIFVEGCGSCISANLRGGNQRDVSEPETEVNIRGPRDSFNESIGTNVSLIRRRLKSPRLWVESMKIGNVSQTDVAIMYLKGIAEEPLIEEVRKRMKDIRIDAVLDSGHIEGLIEDETYTPFPMIYNTERPDVAAANLMEGRIAVLVDGTPNTLILPTTFSHFFKAAEDYYQRPDFALFIRLIRYFSFMILILLPSAYIAITTFHSEMIPTTLAINLLAQREGVPFPVLFEALIMEVSFEIIREAGTRMPRAIGQAVSIVGAIVLGQAAVEAGIVTAMMVIIVALTGIASFTLPGFSLSTSSRIIRFPMMVAASTFGFYGVFIGVILLVAHMVSLRSFGIPYMAPFSPFGLRGQKDTFLRMPHKNRNTRPHASKGGK